MATEDPPLPTAPPLPEDAVMFSKAKPYELAPKPHFEPIKLHFAINHDDDAEARAQIARGVDLDFVVHGNTPLMLALLREQYEIAEMLVEAGADVTIPEIYAWHRQPVHLASRDDRAALVAALLAHGASTQAADGMAMTPLHWAAACGAESVVRVLVAQGAHIHARDDRGRTPLFRAACADHADIVRLLRAEGASLDAQDVFGWSALHQVALCSLPVAADLLELGATPNARSLRGDTPLHLVVARQAPHNLLTLSRTDLQFYTRDLKITSTCTDRQRRFLSDRELLLLLLDYHCDVNIANADGRAPLTDAMTNSHVMFVRWLVLAGARVTLPVSSFPTGWPPGLVSNTALCDFLRAHGASRVLALAILCRAAIRRSLFAPVSANIDALPLPSSLKTFLQISLES